MKRLLLFVTLCISGVSVNVHGLPATNRQAAISNAVNAVDNLAPHVEQIQSETNVSPQIPPEPVKPLTFVWLSAIYILFPAIAIFLNRKVKFLNKVDPLILCYAIGIIVGNVKILPEGIFKFQDMFASIVIPLALPLIFFSIDIRKWFKHAKSTFLASALQILSITITVIAIFFIFRKPLQAQGFDAGMLSSLYAGVYTGGTINMAAIKTALQVDPNIYVLVQASDVVISSLFILFSITFAQRLFLKILPPYEKSAKSLENDPGDGDFGTYEGIFKKNVLLPLLKAFGLSVAIFAVGISLSSSFRSSGGPSRLFSRFRRSECACFAHTGREKHQKDLPAGRISRTSLLRSRRLHVEFQAAPLRSADRHDLYGHRGIR